MPAPDPMEVYATFRVAGRAAIGDRQRLFATAAAAQAATGTPPVESREAVSVRVVDDRGDVIAVRTDVAAADCLDGAIDSYELDLYVPRSVLLPRVSRPIERRFDDGSGYVIDRGAPLRVRGRELAVIDPLLGDRARAVAVADAALAIDPAPPTVLPSAGGVGLVCDPSPVDYATWEADHRRRLAEERASRAEENKRACLERAAAEQARPRRRKKSKKHKKGNTAIEVMLEEMPFDASVACESFDPGFGDDADVMFGGLTPPPPECALTEGGALLVGGSPLGEPARTRAGSTEAMVVFERVTVGDRILVTIPARCGQLRALVPPDHPLDRGGRSAGIGTIGLGVRRDRFWRPRPGSRVTWPDGTPAGRYVGNRRHLYPASAMTEEQGRLCTPISRVDTRVCFDRADLVEQIGR